MNSSLGKKMRSREKTKEESKRKKRGSIRGKESRNRGKNVVISHCRHSTNTVEWDFCRVFTRNVRFIDWFG